MVTLNKIKVGQQAQIADFLDNDTVFNSARFGIEKGQLVQCIAKPGAVVIKKNHQEIAIGKGFCEKIFVELM